MSLTPEERRARRKAYLRDYNAKHAEKRKAYNRRWYLEHREETLAKERRRDRSDMYPRRNAKRLTQLEAEAGRPKPERCEACGGTGKISFDHCHQRGIFRGWLCHNCNIIIGYAHDDPNILRMLIVYLERTKNIISPQLTLPV